MRACMVAYSYYESDNRVRRYAETLVERGWDVDVLALKKEGDTFPYNYKGVNVYGLQKRNKNEKHKINYLLKTMLFFFNSLIFLTKKHFTSKYDLIHIHSVPDFLVFAALVPKIFGTKLILDIHDIVPELYCAKFGTEKNSLIFKVLLFVEKLSTAFCDHVVIANHIWHKRITERSVKPSNCSVILNYPDEGIFGNIKKTRNDNQFIMLYPGTLSRHQGIDIAIKAVSRIKNKIQNLRFHIYGSGTDEFYLKNLVTELNLKNEVKFFKPVPMEQIAQVMANADIGIEPKNSDGFSNEAFSTKILEFMALGVPVIASDTEIHKYYLNASYLRYFKASNIDDLSTSIQEFCCDSLLRNNYAEKARQFIQKLSWHNRKSEYLSILQRILPTYVCDTITSSLPVIK